MNKNEFKQDSVYQRSVFKKGDKVIYITPFAESINATVIREVTVKDVSKEKHKTHQYLSMVNSPRNLKWYQIKFDDFDFQEEAIVSEIRLKKKKL